MLAPALELRDIAKNYHGVIALDEASLAIAPGSIHGIIGENGAGKSSLMQVAYGLVRPDKGSIHIDGVQVDLANPLQAIEHGIGMLHQQASWLEQLSVFDNIMLAEPVTGFIYQHTQEARSKLELIRREFGFTFSLDTKVSQLDYSQRQLVDVLRSLFRGVRVLILDEPLALLSPTQESYLNNLLQLLKMQGISVVVVSHKLAVLHQLCDVISVIKLGKVVKELEPRQVSLRQLTKQMVGRELNLPHPRTDVVTTSNEVVINVNGIGVNGPKGSDRKPIKPILSAIDLTVFKGEIVACVGLPKAGQERLLDVIAGMQPFDSGTLEVLSNTIVAKSRYSIKRARKYGICYAPDPILNLGLVGQLTMAESTYLGYQRTGFGRWGIMSMARKNQHCRQLMKQWSVVPALPRMQSGMFSGGNQQKMVLAREFEQQPKLLLLNQPTHGVDAGAIELVYQRLFKLREQGSSTLMCSTDLDEVLSVADRVCVFYQGKLLKILNASETNKAQLSLLIVKGRLNE